MSKVVLYLNGGLSLGILGLISANPQLTSGWIYAALLASAAGVLAALGHLTAVADWPAERAEHEDFIRSLSDDLVEIRETHDRLVKQLGESHKSSREHVEWWEDKIAMLSYALREGDLSEKTRVEVQELLEQFRTQLDEIESDYDQSKIDLARAADDLRGDEAEVKQMIGKEEWWHDAQRRVFEYGEVAARFFLFSAIVTGLIGIGKISVGS